MPCTHHVRLIMLSMLHVVVGIAAASACCATHPPQAHCTPLATATAADMSTTVAVAPAAAGAAPAWAKSVGKEQQQ